MYKIINISCCFCINNDGSDISSCTFSWVSFLYSSVILSLLLMHSSNLCSIWSIIPHSHRFVLHFALRYRRGFWSSFLCSVFYYGPNNCLEEFIFIVPRFCVHIWLNFFVMFEWCWQLCLLPDVLPFLHYLPFDNISLFLGWYYILWDCSHFYCFLC